MDLVYSSLLIQKHKTSDNKVLQLIPGKYSVYPYRWKESTGHMT
jgi:hypothetical protein